MSNGGAQRKPKIAKGARDFLPEQVRQQYHDDRDTCPRNPPCMLR